MNRYEITNANGTKYEVEGDAFPPDGVFHGEWGDPGDKVLQREATTEQIANSLGTYTEWNVNIIVDIDGVPTTFTVNRHYYVLTNTLNIITTNIDQEIADKAAANQEARDRRLRLKGYANIETIGMAQLRLVIKDILNELRGD